MHISKNFYRRAKKIRQLFKSTIPKYYPGGQTSVHLSGVTPSLETNIKNLDSNYRCDEVDFSMQSISIKILTYPQKRVFFQVAQRIQLDHNQFTRATGTLEGIAQLEKGWNKDRNGSMHGASFKQAIKTLKV